MAYGNGIVYMTCGEGADDTRRVRSFKVGSGFLDRFFACPDNTGSHATVVDGRLLLAQWYNKRLMLLDDDGAILKEYHAPHGIAGVSLRDGNVYTLGTDDEEGGAYWITRIDIRDASRPPEDVALVPFHARSLAFDGAQWWTNHREAHQTVAFDLPA